MGRRRRYLISATADGGERSGRRALIDTANKRKRKRDTHTPELPDEIVWEILIRLPVQSLLRFRSVSKAWRAIISDPSFVGAHLHRCRQAQHQNPSPSFLITPQFYLRRRRPPMALSTNIRFYQWRLHKDTRSTATLLYGRHFPAGEFQTVSEMAHCDGLVLLPTNTKAYVFNPATRDAIVLPESKLNKMPLHGTCLPTGLGIDSSTGRYKVARAFYRSSNDDPMKMVAMGMEVFTVNGQDGGSWRETLEDPPYLMVSSQTATHCKGCLFYFIDKKKHQRPPSGLIRFSLQDETFGVTPLLQHVYGPAEEDIVIGELDGELCASCFVKRWQLLFVWTTEDILDDDPHWSCRYKINVSDQCHPMASPAAGSGGILLRGGHCLLRYDLEAQDVRDEDDIHEMDHLTYVGLNHRDKLGRPWKNLSFFNLTFYTESLVPLTPQASLQALQ